MLAVPWFLCKSPYHGLPALGNAREGAGARRDMQAERARSEGKNNSNGLKRLSELWGMNPEPAVAMGDDGSDIDMLRDFGGFAMAGSAKAVLEAGQGVASSVGEIVRRFL